MPAGDLSTRCVERDETAVLFIATADEQDAITEAWDRLETMVGSLQGRKFFGVFGPPDGAYRVCVQVQDGADAALAGLQSGSIPGGQYLSTTLRGEPPEIYTHIPERYAELMRAADHDSTRPSIEFYRRRDSIDLLIPVKTGSTAARAADINADIADPQERGILAVIEGDDPGSTREGEN
ncbi:GyrI-like domain-containing protein [Micromonospora zamorensis]|uniref:GyrI-like domain-containing protein n=1 Tax=Micromonospora zamorensis TaxID=709883 RepID=UPI00371E61A8